MKLEIISTEPKGTARPVPILLYMVCGMVPGAGKNILYRILLKTGMRLMR